MGADSDKTKGLTLLVNLNWDRVLYGLTIVVALWAGAWVGTLGLTLPF